MGQLTPVLPMSWRFFSYNPMFGLTTWFHHDPETGKNHFRKVQDVTPLLDQNKAEFNDAPGKFDKKGDFRKVASIPAVVIAKWMEEGINVYNPDHAEAVIRKLNDPEWQYLRTAPGTIGRS